jgi:hypothetical protein
MMMRARLHLEAGAIAMQKLIPVVLLILFSLPTFGQKAEVFGGYQLTHFDGGTNSNGWNAALTGNFLPFLGVTADFSGVYNSGTHFYTYTFGPEVHARALGVKPFAHALFGGGTFTGGGVNSTGFTTYIGGGIDVKVLPFVSARLAQVDWMTTRFSGVTNKNNMRYSAGLVLRF